MNITTLGPYKRGIIQHSLFCVWLISLIYAIHVTAHIRIAFFFKVKDYSILYRLILFIHSSLNGHSSHLQILALVNNAALNLSGQIAIQFPALNSFGYIPQKRNG